MSSHLGSSETPSSKGNERMKGSGEDVHGRAKKLERGDIWYPPVHICLLIFSTVLSRIHPILVDIQDVNHLVWVLQGQTLTAVPRKDQMDPGEWSKPVQGSPFGQCCCVSSAQLFRFTVNRLVNWAYLAGCNE